jgi:uncharacterized surface protein with fasciclin (FAS1) repeats
MKKSIALCMLLGACAQQASTESTNRIALPAAPVAAAAAVVAPAAPKADSEKTVADIAVGSPDHTTLVAALQTAGLVPALSSPGGIYTVFAPTNAAFDQLPAGTVDNLLLPEHQADLKRILQHHAAVPILHSKDMQDSQTMAMSDGTRVTFHVQGDKVMVEDATILGSVDGVNGVVHVIDKVLLPPAK